MPDMREIVLLNDILPGPHQHAECRRRAVPNRNLVTLQGFVPVAGTKASAANDIGHAVQPRGKNTVRSAGNPAGIGGAPVYIVLTEIKDDAPRVIMLQHGVVDMINPLGLPGRTGRIMQD
ncbi:hypothetical protein D1872_209960 [compost metagenome]